MKFTGCLGIMVSSLILLLVCSFTCVSSCNLRCPDKPVITPSSLVVKFGDPTSATCVACQQACLPSNESVINMETSLGTSVINGNTVTWTVEQMTVWDLTPKCYYTNENDQCCTNLNVIVYKPPESVSFSFNPSGPLTEGSEVTLQCDVLKVAPVKNLIVTFYRGQTSVGEMRSSNTKKGPVNGTFSLSYKTSKEDNGVQFWCEAKLNLGAEGPQPPLVVKSKKANLSVHRNETQVFVNIFHKLPGEKNKIKMLSSFVLLAASFTTFLCCVSSCNYSCPDKPVITPSSLVVKFGDPTSATCVACQQACLPSDESVINMEASLGTSVINGNTVTWTVEQMTVWDLTPKCYYTNENDQCCTNLNITIYKPPESVSFSFNPSGPLTESSEVTLQCDVLKVAPAKNLIVTFYRGQTSVGEMRSNNTKKGPVNEIFSLSYKTIKEDNGVQFWCEAKLDLGAEGPQPPLVVKSDNLTATVYYGPELKVPADPAPISIIRGETLHLSCLGEGNPKPQYNWTLPSNKGHSSENDLRIYSVDSQDGGQYICTVSNTVNSVSVTFDVTVQENFIPYIIGAVVIAAAVILIIAGVIYSFYYKRHKMGEYRPKDALCLDAVQHSNLSAPSSSDYFLSSSSSSSYRDFPKRVICVPLKHGLQFHFQFQLLKAKRRGGKLQKFLCASLLALRLVSAKLFAFSLQLRRRAFLHLFLRPESRSENSRVNMFPCLFLLISFLNVLRWLHVSACDYSCPDKPVITPSSLVVKFGDPTSATCVACQQACLPSDENVINMETSRGTKVINGNTVTWTVKQMNVWNLTPKCYYTNENAQCCTNLNVIVYKPAESVSFSFNRSGPLTEGSEVTLQCDVLKVAPAKNLIVTFYRGQTSVGEMRSNNTEKGPVNGTFSLSYKTSKEDNGVQFWCEAKLDLGAEGPQPPLVVKSDNLTATVYYGPELKVPADPAPISIIRGETLHLSCLGEGNPKPQYNWTLPSNKGHSSGNDLRIDSVDSQDGGQYICTVSNTVNSVSVTFDVTVQENFIPYIIGAVVIAAAVILIIAGVIYSFYYKQNKMGKYQLKDVFRLSPMHPTTVPLC
ncbi:uncharacterized protein LOC129376829 [Poeciliopsis prolifica]|uniref:uncharacterized protein LOC129376829 n=1 Tax=Poeciliopsis prolifica TaxID=188132 RepID=UPI0024142692|nr:uncharacterized protein LOC129376829 [Poeciliopsis prolifica]